MFGASQHHHFPQIIVVSTLSFSSTPIDVVWPTAPVDTGGGETNIGTSGSSLGTQKPVSGSSSGGGTNAGTSGFGGGMKKGISGSGGGTKKLSSGGGAKTGKESSGGGGT